MTHAAGAVVRPEDGTKIFSVDLIDRHALATDGRPLGRSFKRSLSASNVHFRRDRFLLTDDAVTALSGLEFD